MKVFLPAKRCVHACVRLVIVIGLLASFAFSVSAAPAANPRATAVDWLDYLNSLRAIANLPPVTENASYTAGDQAHAEYEVLNNTIGHDESVGNPGYSAAGNLAAQNSNVAVSAGNNAWSYKDAIDGWMTGPFHALGILDPKLAQTGFGIKVDPTVQFPNINAAAALDVGRGRTATPTYPVFFPGNNSQMPYTSYDGSEYPDPLTGCGFGAATTSGPPLMALFAATPTNASATLTREGTSGNLELCSYTETTYTNTRLDQPGAQDLVRNILGARHAVVIMPKLAFTNGVYHLAITNNGTVTNITFTVGPTGGGGGGGGGGNPPTGGLQYYALANPIRVFDSRRGLAACITPGAPLGAKTPVAINARSSCTGIPAAALAVAGNATVVNDTGAGPGFVTLFPTGVAAPNASNLNYVPGDVIPNAFTVGLGTDGGFNLYALTGVNAVVDLTGFYAPPGTPPSATSTVAKPASTAGLFFHPLAAPVRLLDTRAGQSACNTPGAPLAGNASRSLNARTACTGIPASAQAVIGNGTVVNNTGAGPGFVTFYPGGVSSPPNASNLNYIPGQVVPNAFTVGLGGDGTFNTFATTGINFVIDLTGYYDTNSTGGLLFTPLAAPIRLLDTRSGQSACTTPGSPLTAHVSLSLNARTACSQVAASAKAVVGNGTVVNGGASPGFVTLYPGDVATPPNASNLNYIGGQTVPNAFTVGLAGDGSFNTFATTSVNFIIDLIGYFS